MIVDALPWVTTCAALTQLALVRRWPIPAFTIGIVNQPVWMTYALAAHAYGFLLGCVPFLAVNVWQLRASVRGRVIMEQPNMEVDGGFDAGF